MGSTVFIGLNSKATDKDGQWLVITLGGADSSLFDLLIDNALVEYFSDFLDKAREYDVLAQLHFSELSMEDFKDTIKAIRDYLCSDDVHLDWRQDAKELWQREFEPRIIQDDRYRGG